MILCWRRHGKAGGCRIPKKRKPLTRVFYIERTHRNGWTICDEDVLTYTSREVLFHITGFYQWLVDSSSSSFLMTDKHQSGVERHSIRTLKTAYWKTTINLLKEKYQRHPRRIERCERNIARCKHKTNQGCNAMHLRWNPYPRRKSTG